jgi:phage terminase small subunit
MPILSNPRHERFAQELANGVSATEAYERAGFARNRVSAHRLKQKPNIGERVSELLKQREHINVQATAKAIEKTALTKEWVIERLIENANRAMQNVPVLDRDGRPTGEYGAGSEQGAGIAWQRDRHVCRSHGRRFRALRNFG